MIPSPWVLLGFCGGLIAFALGGYFYGSHAKDTEWQARWNGYQAEMQAVATDAQAKARAAEAANSDLAAQLETTRHDADVKTASADARVRAALAAARLRTRQACAGGSNLPGNQGSGGAAEAAGGSDGGLAERTDDYLARCSAAANVLAAWVREAHGWAVSLPK